MKCDNLCGFSLPLVPAAAVPTQRKGKIHGIFLGGGRLCCPPGDPKETHRDLCLKAWVPAMFLLTKPAKKVNSASLKSARVTLRCLPHLHWRLLYCSQANHMPNTSNCSSSQPSAKVVGMCYKGILWRGVASTLLLVLSSIYCQWREFVSEQLSRNWAIGF